MQNKLQYLVYQKTQKIDNKFQIQPIKPTICGALNNKLNA